MIQPAPQPPNPDLGLPLMHKTMLGNYTAAGLPALLPGSLKRLGLRKVGGKNKMAAAQHDDIPVPS